MMICRHCQKESWNVRTQYDAETETLLDICNNCGLEGAGTGIPDVYLERTGTQFQNLSDEMGRPYEIRSKRHKKEIMDRLGVSEAGDRVHGAPYGSKSWIEGTRDFRRKGFAKDRPLIRETLRQWRQKHA